MKAGNQEAGAVNTLPFLSLALRLEDLLGWCEHPADKPHAREWLDATKDDLRAAAQAAGKQSRHDRHLAGEVDRAERLSLKLATLLHSHPDIATQPVQQWPMKLHRDLVDELAVLASEFRETGETEPAEPKQHSRRTDAATNADDDAGDEASTPRKYVKKAEAERIARENYKELWRHDNASKWAREIGCNPRTVKTLTAWNDAAQKRQKRSTVANKLRTVVDPKIVEAFMTGDAGLIGSLSDTDREKLDAMPEADRQEILRLMEESADD